MLRSLALAGAFLCALSISAQADHHRAPAISRECNVTMPCDLGGNNFLAGIRSIKVTMHRDRRAENRTTRRMLRSAASNEGAKSYAPVRVNGLVGTLAAKAAEIATSCGSQVISAVRHTFIAGTRHISLHASGKAVDMQGNPACIYSHLAGWPGGYSVDYARMKHVHISYDPAGGREMGAHFNHGGGHRHYARHGHHRYASR